MLNSSMQIMSSHWGHRLTLLQHPRLTLDAFSSDMKPVLVSSSAYNYTTCAPLALDTCGENRIATH